PRRPLRRHLSAAPNSSPHALRTPYWSAIRRQSARSEIILAPTPDAPTHNTRTPPRRLTCRPAPLAESFDHPKADPNPPPVSMSPSRLPTVRIRAGHIGPRDTSH